MPGERGTSPADLYRTEDPPGDFEHRHLGPGPRQIDRMPAELGLNSLDELMTAALPQSLHGLPQPRLRTPAEEQEVLDELATMAAANQPDHAMIGMGYHDTTMPAVIHCNVLQNPGWYTAYTPYQAEISQGRLEALLHFQHLICDLTGMELANASVLDEATAAAEAMTLCRRAQPNAGNRFLVDHDCLPQTLDVLTTRASGLGLELATFDPEQVNEQLLQNCFGVLLQYPGCSGRLTALQEQISLAHQHQALAVVAADPMALVLLKTPGAMGADVVVGSAQRFGLPMGYGGPHAGFLASRDRWRRLMPGRIIGVSVDCNGRPALRMALQTREQHIRREKATSNLCTAQALPAMLATFYAMYHGPEGLQSIARRILHLTTVLARGLQELGFAPNHWQFFDTLELKLPPPLRKAVCEGARQQGILLRPFAADGLGISVNENTRRKHLEVLWQLFLAASPEPAATLPDYEQLAARPGNLNPIPENYRRQEPLLSHPDFHRYHSETAMMRYLGRLRSRDLSLDQAMIPLGSCTMKLNAAVEMMPLSWPGFAGPHPFAPASQVPGYQQLLQEFAQQLKEITGYPAVSLQPNSGAQGEFAGLMAIRRYHESRGEQQRRICLIPASAHGTNPASAVMAGMEVVVIPCDSQGNVDLARLEEKARDCGDRLAALMVTYPSTHGVFEEHIQRLCEVIHEQGGQVYMDGANFNALAGWLRPVDLGIDVCHLNLHKTFCIPHGGGGPGMGPIAAGAHLGPFMPGHWVLGDSRGAVSAAPWGSALILLISWAYLRLMGTGGLRRATAVAILQANVLARRLSSHYPVLYTGPGGWVAHECILDLRPFRKSSGISDEDVAKRLMDYGFHAPTMSFPVSGTLMIEPTESEPPEELERFCRAMSAIREEIRQVEQGLPIEHSPLRNAPHSQARISCADWPHPYSRRQAAFPLPEQADHKYWPALDRINNSHGDRNLFCTCPFPADD